MGGSPCRRCLRWVWTRSARGWTDGSERVCGACTMSRERDARRSTCRTRPRAGASGWTKNLGRFDRRRPDWPGRRGNRPAGRRCVGSSKKSLRLETVPTSGQRPSQRGGLSRCPHPLEPTPTRPRPRGDRIVLFRSKRIQPHACRAACLASAGSNPRHPQRRQRAPECLGIPQSHEPAPLSDRDRCGHLGDRHCRAGCLRRPNRPSQETPARRPRQRPHPHPPRLSGARYGLVSTGHALHWLPPYSPELNLIEILWRKIKYEWLPPRAYLGFNHLQSELQSILDQFGSKYTITFG